jgi:hypothetical protein
MTNQEFILKKEDYEFLQKIHNLQGGENILSLCETSGYYITPELVEELVEYCEFELGEEKKVNIRFWVNPSEKNKRFGKKLTEKIIKTFGKYDAISLAFHTNLANEKIRQKKDFLIEKRITVPDYVARIIQTHSLINCTTIEEIENYDFSG